MIGGNSPPPHDAFSLHIEELFALVSATTAGATVENDEQEAALDELLKELRKAGKDANAERAAEKKPHDDAAAAVQAKWKPLVDRCDMGMKAIAALLTPYRTAKQAAKEAAAAKAREEAEAIQKAAQEALQQSGELADKFAAEEQLRAAKRLTAAANKIGRAPTGLRTSWVAELGDASAALRHYMRTQPDALKEWLLAQAQRDVNAGARTIPGFNINQVRKAA